MFLRKGVYPYDCIDEWQQFNEASLTEKEEFYSNLTVEDITDSDYIDAKLMLDYIQVTWMWRILKFEI